MKIFFFIIIFFFLYLSSILNFDRISQDYIFKIESGDNYSNIKDKISKKDINIICVSKKYMPDQPISLEVQNSNGHGKLNF